MTVARRLAIATLGFRGGVSEEGTGGGSGGGGGGGGGTTVLVELGPVTLDTDEVFVMLSDSDSPVVVEEPIFVTLVPDQHLVTIVADQDLTVSLDDDNYSVTLDC